MTYAEFQDARQFLAEEGMGVYVRAEQRAEQQAEQKAVSATAAAFRERGMVEAPVEPRRLEPSPPMPDRILGRPD